MKKFSNKLKIYWRKNKMTEKLEAKFEKRYAIAIRSNPNQPYTLIRNPDKKVSRYFSYEEAKGHLWENLEDSIVIDVRRLLNELVE